ncbi:DNA methyltransferase [Syntrophothermus lipocalidus]|uniref:DNA methylase N-4/N-6 domain protein n=1 Tax=Syntrophothermus lipocalidus (strain DSM 12680 / TGB-C1) TaxID=643648 RepID=D7CMW0_SYNLT|nr:DNA methyltransferase [Syntrophothermus lipocalidus]ADI02045.1 DNA methylase N-4/N-6 domain protein [Syntrophothermus lipocalidus DSM 12680]
MAQEEQLFMDIPEGNEEGQQKQKRRRFGLTKERLDRVRQIEGFPIAKDEDIINLSDPPYYTACPNPFIEDFIKEHGKPYDPDNDDYRRQPFAADVSEGKNDPIYNAHSYHTKVPHRAIMRYILHYTEPGDIVFDGFCGTGMTGVAASLCGDRKAVESLGYRVLDDGTILDEKGRPFSKLGARKAILIDLSPAATFIAYNYNTPVDVQAFEREARRILEEVERECGWMYETQHVVGGKVQKGAKGSPIMGKINYTVWSDVFICPHCSAELVFWEVAVDKEEGKVRDEFPCPHCGADLTKRTLERATERVYDRDIGQTVTRARQVPVLINYSVGNKRYEKKPDEYDLDLIRKIEESEIPYWYPTDRMPEGYNTEQPKVSHGITHVHHFYTRRNLWVLALVLNMAKALPLKLLLIWLTSSLIRTTKMYKFTLDRKMGTVSGTLYIPSLWTENSPLKLLKYKLLDFCKVRYPEKGYVLVETTSATNTSIPKNYIDYIFTDPPFGGNLMYSELNFLWEAWLRVFTNNKPEAVENKAQGKGPREYQELMEKCFAEYYRVLKPGRWMTVVFHNSQNRIWNAIQEAIMRAGFVIADVRTLDKKQGTFKQVTSTTAVKQDLVISAYKPNGGLEKRFHLEAGTEEGVWDFVRTHLKQLPVFVEKNGKAEVIAERQNFLLYDRMVAFHVQRGVAVPMGAAEFYAGLKQRFPERDGMYFLPDQVNEYDKKRLSVREFEQLSLFVIDEKSAIQWLRSELEKKPQTYQEIHPKFLRELHKARHEKLPELSELLEQNFLKDDYGRWYVPDPGRQSDLEKMREKALLKEFEEYKEGRGRLKVFRTEALRAGFKACWAAKDYKTIVEVARRIPDTVLQEDTTLLMYYDNALMRLDE